MENNLYWITYNTTVTFYAFVFFIVKWKHSRDNNSVFMNMAHNHRYEDFECRTMSNCPFVGTKIISKERFGNLHDLHRKKEEEGNCFSSGYHQYFERMEEKKYHLRCTLNFKVNDDFTHDVSDDIIENILSNDDISKILGEFINAMDKKDEERGKECLKNLKDRLKGIPEYDYIQNTIFLEIFLGKTKKLSLKMIFEMAKNVEVTSIMDTIMDNSRKQEWSKAHERLLVIYKDTKRRLYPKKDICTCQ